jgi:beta-galactosidase/beta-glucuronidase
VHLYLSPFAGEPSLSAKTSKINRRKGSRVMKRVQMLLGLFLLGWGLTAAAAADDGNNELKLAGSWRFRLDPDGVGQRSRWFAESLGDETIQLPGTTDQAGKGYTLDPQTMSYAVPFDHSTFPGTQLSTRVDERGFLVRPFMYIGAAWYQRTFTVPENWRRKHVRMRLERVMWTSRAWIDGNEVGSRDSLVTPHVYDLGRLAPGEHRLTVLVDNSMAQNMGTIGHAYGPETQSRWNGIVGEIELTATDPQFVKDVQVYPASDRRTVRVRAIVANHADETASANLTLTVQSFTESEVVGSVKVNVALEPGEQLVEANVPIEKHVQPFWAKRSTGRYPRPVLGKQGSGWCRPCKIVEQSDGTAGSISEIHMVHGRAV